MQINSFINLAKLEFRCIVDLPLVVHSDERLTFMDNVRPRASNGIGCKTILHDYVDDATSTHRSDGIYCSFIVQLAFILQLGKEKKKKRRLKWKESDYAIATTVNN